MISTTSAVLLRPWLGRGVLGLWAGGVLIDGDHYAWFVLRQRRLSPAAAMRFFGQSAPTRSAATRALHNPLAPLLVLLIGRRRRPWTAVALGMAVHVALDAHHEARMDGARAAALERDDFACQACGIRGPHVGTHLCRQPLVLPAYESANLISLCDRCHETAHARLTGAVAWR